MKLLILLILLIPFNILAENKPNRLLLNVGVAIGASEDSNERNTSANRTPLVSAGILFDVHYGARYRLIKGLYITASRVAAWQEGDQEYTYVQNGTTYNADDIDLDIKKRYWTFGARYSFRAENTFSPFIGGGIIKGKMLLRQSGKDLEADLGAGNIPSTIPDEGDLNGQYIEAGIRFLWGTVGLQLSARGYKQEAGPFPTLDGEKVNFKGGEFMFDLLFRIF